jgi:hypothetical protein
MCFGESRQATIVVDLVVTTRMIYIHYALRHQDDDGVAPRGMHAWRQWRGRTSVPLRIVAWHATPHLSSLLATNLSQHCQQHDARTQPNYNDCNHGLSGDRATIPIAYCTWVVLGARWWRCGRLERGYAQQCVTSDILRCGDCGLHGARECRDFGLADIDRELNNDAACKETNHCDPLYWYSQRVGDCACEDS